VTLELFGPDRRDPALHTAWLGPGARGDEVVVGYVGRLAPEKQVRRLREVADLPGVRLVVVGDGPERPWLERHLPDAVFTGMLGGDELARAFATLDLFVHTGEAETFCQTVQEAQASGVPVVAAAAGGPLDLVQHGHTGLLYDVTDPGSLRRTVAGLVADRSLRARLAARAGADVSGRSWAAVVQQLVDDHYGPVSRLGSAVAAA
jgi:phosphatidylinositol alpha 1,6-mannosyltransferase